MRIINLSSREQLRKLMEIERDNLISINNVSFGANYPIIEISNNYVFFYDAIAQDGEEILPPFHVILT